MPGGASRTLRRVGALVEGPAFHPYLSGRANLARLDAADPHSDARTAPARIDAALDRVGLLPAATKRYRAYSLGMRQRLAIANALLVPRDLLVLDEPTNGLDPQGTREVRHLIGELADDGTTVLVSSHLLSEVDQMCSHVGVMFEGPPGHAGPARATCTTGAAQTVRVDTDRSTTPAAVLRDAGPDRRPARERPRHRPARRGRGREGRARARQRRRARARLHRRAARRWRTCSCP